MASSNPKAVESATSNLKQDHCQFIDKDSHIQNPDNTDKFVSTENRETYTGCKKSFEPKDQALGNRNENSRIGNAIILSRKKTETLKELAACPICLERLVKPKMLPCQHTFCLTCLTKCTIDGDGKTLSCPQCRTENLIPKDGVTGFPINIHLQSVLDLLALDIENGSQQCTVCNTLCGVTVCKHCDQMHCKICMELHLDELKQQMARIVEQFQSLKFKINNKMHTFEEYCASIKTKVSQTGEKKMKKLLDTISFLQHHVDEVYKSQECAHMEVTKKVESSSNQLQQVIEKEYDSLGSPEEKVDLFMTLHSESESILSEVASLEHTNFTFDPESLSISVNHKSDFPRQLSSAEEEAGAAGSEEPQNHISEETTKETADAHSRFYRAKSFMAKSKLGLGLLQRPSGIAVSPWSNEVFVVAMDNHRVFAFDLHSGKVQRSFGSRGQKLGEFLCPFGIALVPNRQLILVTDKWKHCIHVFDSLGQFVRQVGSKGRSPGHFRSPESICVDQKGKIYVCDTCNNRIQVLNVEGEFLAEIGVKSKVEAGSLRHRSMFQEPTGIAVSSDGQRVVVCDFGHHRIHVFSSGGEHLLTFGQKGTLRGQFIHPECVAIDSLGFIFIGDSGNGRVQVCRPDGRFVRTFGSKGSNNGQFSWISGIAITDKFDVVVSDFKNHSVQIF